MKMQDNDHDTPFENSDVDPGFDGHQQDNTLKGREDKREHDIDVNLSIKEMREGKQEPKDSTADVGHKGDPDADKNPDEQNDALNYKNDRDNGAFNPKNI